MSAIHTPVQSQWTNEDWGLDELREGILRPMAQAAMLCGLLALIALANGERISSWAPAIWLPVAGFTTLRITRFSRTAAAVFLLASLWLIVTSSVLLFPDIPVAPLYSLIILPTAVLLWPWASVLTASCSVAALVWIEEIRPGAEAPPIFWVTLFMIAGAAGLSWLLVTTQRTLLAWVWVAYQEAEDRLIDARARQGELGRVTKSLNETLTQLEDLNRQLAEARAAAEEARRLKSEFAAAVSHELRTPLNLIIGFAEMLVLPERAKVGEVLPPACRRQLQAIYRNAYHISNLVDDILDLSQIDAFRLALRKEMLSLGEVVAETMAVVGDLVQDEGLSMTIDVPPDLPLVHADRARLRQVMINLVSNASRFTDEGGITIRARSEGRQVVVAVSDTGAGIPPEDLPHVFEEFRQFGDRKRGGSGLGLNICKRLIELHGGNMWVDSVLGRGSTFSFSLPLINAVAAVPDSPSLRRNLAVIANRTVQPTLAVVDRDGLSKVVGRYLDNYRVEVVENVQEAKRLLTSGQASALLFCHFRDVEAWREIQRAEPALHPVAFCPLRTTGQARRELGVADYLTKPVTPTQLGAALRRLKGRKKRWKSIGIVEDHLEMADLLVQMIGSIQSNCRVWHAASGREALTMLSECQPEVILLDLLLPHLNGYELLHEMRRDERFRDIPVIVITGAEDRDERIVAEMVGITRPGGMTVGEGMACLNRLLNSLLIRSRDSDQG